MTAPITDGDITPVLRPLDTPPTEHRRDRTPEPLPPDAVHLATANGEGADPSMLGSAELDKTLAAYPDDVEAALTEYDQAMFVHSGEPVTFAGIEVQGFDSEDNTVEPALKMINGDGR